MGHNRKHKSAAAEKPARIEAPPHDWLTPVSVDAPCGPDLEYDPEFVVLEAQVAARGDAQYGDFVGSPEPVNWSDVERDCRRLMMRSKDMRLAVLFTRCRTRMTGATGLAEGLQLLTAWLNGLYKTELIHRRAPWKTKESVELATLQWVAWFNHHRLMEPLGYIPPAEAEANYYRQLRNTADAPALT
ncbi:type VI secretion system ImpA family N-terminal domain-containing protein [Paraburkholderia tropica]|uniref:ImpA, N-terminal, type VI secretion system n=1 Tax=Paraburkholderia tropica TaxID=92647 RepID=A0AAQ1JUB7_9BURK|nr:hypothetical protein EHZ25_08555 [Paraburkholderia tropica]SEJ70385.1 ImpA, N-terminal, type VI secretion system [Paraburkholderia tropica]